MNDERTIAGRYRLLERVGSGGMGTVSRAFDQTLRRTVAVKEVHVPGGLSGQQNDELVRRTMREGRIAARLQHPQLITVYDVVEDGGRPYLIMEHFPSRSLKALGTLPYASAAWIAAQAAEALASAHASGVVHRDVKPANILVGEDAAVKITDFGVSRVVEDLTATMTGMFGGTPAFLAPEVAKGGKATFASDVYSLGATLYAVIEGVSPAGDSANPMGVLYRVASGEINKPRHAGPLTDVLLWLLSADPAARPTMAEAKKALTPHATKPTLTIALPASGGTAEPAAATVPVPDAAPAAVESAPESPPAESDVEAESAPIGEAPEEGEEDPQNKSDSEDSVTEPDSAPQSGAAPKSESAESETPPESAPPVAVVPAVAFSPPARAAASSGPGASPPASNGSRARRARAIGVAAGLIVVAVAAALVTTLVNNDDSPEQNPAAQADKTVSRTTTTTGKPEPTTTTTTPPPTTTTTEQPPPQESPTPAAAITDYYKLMPGQLDLAWNRLSPSFQNGQAGGQSGYATWWDKFSGVAVSGVTATADNTVEATVVYTFKDGHQQREQHRYTLVNVDGAWLIDKQKVISSRAI